MKTKLIYTALTTALILLIGGCMRIDYAVYKSRYPASGVGGYLWTKFFHK